MAKGDKTAGDPASLTKHGTTKAPAEKGAAPAAPVKKGPKAK